MHFSVGDRSDEFNENAIVALVVLVAAHGVAANLLLIIVIVIACISKFKNESNAKNKQKCSLFIQQVNLTFTLL